MCIVDLGWVYICSYNFFVSEPKFTKFLSSIEGVMAVYQVCFQLLMSWFVLEIFATKLWSCSELRAQSILGGSISVSIIFLLVFQNLSFFVQRSRNSSQWSFFRYIDRFLRYLWSKSKVVLNRAKFWTFFALPNFKEVMSPKCCHISDNAHLMSRHVAKFHGVFPFNPKDMSTSTLN